MANPKRHMVSVTNDVIMLSLPLWKIIKVSTTVMIFKQFNYFCLMATGTIDKLCVQTRNATLVTSNYVTVSITLHLVIGMMITLFCVNLVAVSWVVIKFSKGSSKAPSPPIPRSPKTPGHNSVKYRSSYFASFLDCRYEFFSGFSPSV